MGCLNFDALFFSYSDRPILRGAFLSLKSHSICGLYGRNGSGKTTLMKLGAGLLRPSSGNIFLNNQSLGELPVIKRYKKMAFLTQKFFLPQDIYVKTLIKVLKKQRKDIIDGTFLYQHKSIKVGALSTGEKRYLEFCLIMNLNREYYLLDEPFTGLAPKMIEKMQKILLNRKNEEKGILISDHYNRYVEQIEDYAYVIQGGYCRVKS